jgi:hypothetical protein
VPGPIALGLALIAAFLLVESKYAVALSVFRRRQLHAANLVMLPMLAVLFALWFVPDALHAARAGLRS